MRYAIIIVILLSLGGCATTKVPMDILNYPGPASSGKDLVIALRGLGGSVKDFEEYGFVDALHSAYPQFDLICPDAHFGYYRERSLLTRLQQDVILPAQAAGYERIYLVGVSLGGLGSLLSLREDPELYQQVILLAPYSGDDDLHEAVENYLAEGGQAPWESDEFSGSEKSIAELWQWLLSQSQLMHSGNIWLAYGTEDRLSGHQLLASQLPENRVVTMEGGHRATVFVELWRRILSQRPFSLDEVSIDKTPNEYK